MRLFPAAAAAVEANSASLDPKTTEEAEAVSEAVAPPDDEVITGEDETLGNWTTLSVVVLPVEVASEVVVVCTNNVATMSPSSVALALAKLTNGALACEFSANVKQDNMGKRGKVLPASRL